MKRIISILLTAALLTASGLTAFADNLFIAAPPVAPQKSYVSISGKVTDIRDDGAGYTYVSIDNNGSPYVFVVDSDTYNAGETGFDAINAGDEFIGFYDTSAPAVMIYPPQYRAVVAAVNYKQGVIVNVFDENMLSLDGTLKISVGNDTVITDRNGAPYTGGITGKTLVIYAPFVAASYPGQATPTKIVVLDGQTAAGGKYVINGQEISGAPDYYTKADGAVMVPLRAVAEALGYNLIWDDASKSVYLNNVASLKIGDNDYIFARMAPFTLADAPELVNDRTFVPLEFFSQVLRSYDAYVSDGQIFITTIE